MPKIMKYDTDAKLNSYYIVGLQGTMGVGAFIMGGTETVGSMPYLTALTTHHTSTFI